MDNATAALAISIATAVSTAIVPVVLAYVNNRHEIKVKKIDLYDIRRADAISAYIRSAGAYVQNPRSETAAEYGRAYGEIFLYVPESLWGQISALNEKIVAKCQTPDVYAELSAVCMELGKLQSDCYQFNSRNHKQRNCGKR